MILALHIHLCGECIGVRHGEVFVRSAYAASTVTVIARKMDVWHLRLPKCRRESFQEAVGLDMSVLQLDTYDTLECPSTVTDRVRINVPQCCAAV